jgi:hypothetical protein
VGNPPEHTNYPGMVYNCAIAFRQIRIGAQIHDWLLTSGKFF